MGFKDWYQKNMGHLHSAKKHAEGAAHTIRAGGEAALVGAALGAYDAHMGLDYQLKLPQAAPAAGQPATAPKSFTIPVDGVLAVAGMVGGVALATHEDGIGQDARNVGAAALGILTFRKMQLYSAKVMRTVGQVPKFQNTIPFAQSVGAAGAAPAAHGRFAGDQYYGNPGLSTGHSVGGYGQYSFNGDPAAAMSDPIIAAAKMLGT